MDRPGRSLADGDRPSPLKKCVSPIAHLTLEAREVRRAKAPALSEAQALELLEAGWPTIAAGGVTLRPLGGGSRHRPWAVCKGGRPQFVLRPHGGLPKAGDLPLDLWDEMATGGVPASRPITTARAEAGPAVLWTWRPGRVRRLGRTILSAQSLGLALGRLHQILTAQGRPLVHGDPSPGNLLWLGDRLAGLIDWEDAAPGEPADDLAVVWASLPDAHSLDWMKAAKAWAWLHAFAASYGKAGGPVVTANLAVRAIRRQEAVGKAWLAEGLLTGRQAAVAKTWLCRMSRAAEHRGLEAQVETWMAEIVSGRSATLMQKPPDDEPGHQGETKDCVSDVEERSEMAPM